MLTLFFFLSICYPPSSSPTSPSSRVSCGRHGGFTCDDECEKLNERPELARPFPANVSCPSSSSSASSVSSSSSSSSSSSAAAVVGQNTSPARAARADEASAAAREIAIADGWWHLRVGGSGSEEQRKNERAEGKLGEDGGAKSSDESGIVVAADTAAGREADASAAALWSSLSVAFAVAKEAAAAEGRRLAGGGLRRRRRENRGGRRGGARSDDGETELEFEGENILLIPERRTDGRDWSIDGARLPPRVVKAALAGQRAFLKALPAYPGGRGGGGGGEGGGGGRGGAEKDGNETAAAAPPRPPLLPFSGRGIVFLGGGPTYLVPTLVALRALRLGGCSLPAEVWFPRAEAPTRGLEGLLAGLGAVARLLPGAARTVEGALGAKAGVAAAAAAAASAEGGGGGKSRKQKRVEKGDEKDVSSSSVASTEKDEEEEGEEEGEHPASDGSDADTVPLGPSLGPAGGDGDLSGFTMKAAALLLSRFEEVLFLDSDNVAALNPETLFESREFRESGAVLWPDYWESTAARDAAAALGLDEDDEEGGEESDNSGSSSSSNDDARSPPSSSSSSSSSPSPPRPPLPRLRGSHESGQMLFDKARTWPALALAAYFNSAPGFYYELLSCFMGKGDKETFAAALAATRTRFHKIETPVGSVGLQGLARRCWGGQRWCSAGGYAGNTMTQHDT